VIETQEAGCRVDFEVVVRTRLYGRIVVGGTGCGLQVTVTAESAHVGQVVPFDVTVTTRRNARRRRGGALHSLPQPGI